MVGILVFSLANTAKSRPLNNVFVELNRESHSRRHPWPPRVRSPPHKFPQLTPLPQKAHVSKHAQVALPSRRQCLLLFTATTALTAMEMPVRAQDIPLFGLRKGLRKVEEEAELIVKQGLEATEKEIEVAEKEVQMVEKEIEEAVRTSNLAQAGAVAVAELLGVVIASSIVNAILGPEAKKA